MEKWFGDEMGSGHWEWSLGMEVERKKTVAKTLPIDKDKDLHKLDTSPASGKIITVL